MASLVISTSLSRLNAATEPMTKDEPCIEEQEGKNVLQSRRRFYSSGDAHALWGTKVYNLTCDWSNCSDVNTFNGGSPLAVNSQENTPLGVMVLESILRKYEVDKSDFDALMDIRWAVNDDHDGIEELYDLSLFEWNLEETLLKEEEEETTDSLEEYFTLLDECLQARSYRARSNSTGSSSLQPGKEIKYSTQLNENIKGRSAQNSCAGQQKNEKTEVNQRSKTMNGDVSKANQDAMKQHVNKHSQNLNDENLKGREKSFKTQRIVEDHELNSADLSSSETIQSNKPSCQSCELSMVSLATTVWSHDHTYCLTCSATKTEESLEKGVTIVTSKSLDYIVQLKHDAPTETPNKKIIAANKEEFEKGAKVAYMEARDIPYTVMPAETGSDVVTAKLLDGGDIPHKEVVQKNDGNEIAPEDKPRDSTSAVASEELESSDVDKPHDSPNNNTSSNDRSIISAEPKSENIDETPETPTKKICKGPNNDKIRSRASNKSHHTIQSCDSPQSRDSNQSRDSTELRDSTAPCDSSQPCDSNPRPKTDTCNTPSPLRRSKRTRQPIPRRLDTCYY